MNGLISKSHLAGYHHLENSQWNICKSKVTMGVIMPTIFDLLYREYCRARLAEMRRQLLISARRSEAREAQYHPADLDDDERADVHRESGHGAPN
ncbi:hypothetical protein NLM27_38220 [Bradyrhizobium sp. CCGB12]|uniref:hypothetical protein n=1 Tax=Bradyrhizobium sp. CCGB12 TaxID=2949632 RepID=UPI0020B35F08|nr:hypothetical protein [Bradyrhizobium sp. CCGB12]MCP3394592.1 hypothetical protein [Bradyrhizobium sp. CCGB12]